MGGLYQEPCGLTEQLVDGRRGGFVNAMGQQSLISLMDVFLTGYALAFARGWSSNDAGEGNATQRGAVKNAFPLPHDVHLGEGRRCRRLLQRNATRHDARACCL